MQVLRGLANVDAHTSPSDGVWHPDSLLPRMAWPGSGCSSADAGLPAGRYFNPFALLPQHLLVDAFTEGLAAAAPTSEEGKALAQLQWCMPQYGSRDTAADRGNLPIAQQDARPPWLSKPGWLAFACLRAWPLTQMQQLCAALHDELLPLGRPAVQALIRQLVYHVGELTDASPPALLWRTGWRPPADLLPTLHEELARLAGDMASAPREFGAAQLLGDLSASLSGWHAPLRDVSRRFAAMAEGWAEELEASAREIPPEQARPVRAKQCLLRMTALLCHGAGELAAGDAAQVLHLAVQARHGIVYSSGTGLQREIARLRALCHWTLARRAAELVAAARADANMLTGALRAVLVDAPRALPWQLLSWPGGPGSASFEAVGEGQLYSLNICDGTILENGLPPGRLPKEILDHRLYRRW